MKIIEEKKIVEDDDFSLYRITFQGERRSGFRVEEKDQVVLCIYDAFAKLIVVEKERPLFEDSFITVPSIKVESSESPKDATERLLRSLHIDFEKGMFFNTINFVNNPEVSNARTFVVLFTIGSNDVILDQIFRGELPKGYKTVKSIDLDDAEFTSTSINAVIASHITAMKNVLKDAELAVKAKELNNVMEKVGDSALDMWETAISEKLRDGENPDIVQIGKDILDKKEGE